MSDLISRIENTLSADANPFCNSLKTFPKLFIGPNTLNNNKINLILLKQIGKAYYSRNFNIFKRLF